MTTEPKFTSKVIQVTMAAVSDQGSRDYNEDAAVVVAGKAHNLLAVADGMGGHAAGEVASGLAVEVFKQRFEAANEAETEPKSFVYDSIDLANRAIRQDAVDNPEREGMGSTCVLALVHGNKLSIGHVGDSRGYLIRGGAIRQLTRDHSFVEEMVKAGMITPHETHTNPQRNVILQSLGCSDTIKIDVSADVTTLRPGDYILLCSDGLTAVVADQEIAEIVDRLKEPQAICQELVDLTNKRGAPDNVTVVTGRFDGEVAQGPPVAIFCDEDNSRDLYRLILPRGNYRPQFHSPDTESLQFNSQPRVILVEDSSNPQRALSLCKTIRANPSTARTPTVLVSDGSITPQEGRASGATIVIHTQALLGQLITTLDRVIEATTGRICVIEATTGSSAPIVRALKTAGFAVRVHQNENDLKHTISQHPPHALLIHMNERTRIEPFCRRMRSLPALKSCPLVLSAEGAASDPTQAFLLGADYYLPDTQDIINLVQMLTKA